MDSKKMKLSKPLQVSEQIEDALQKQLEGEIYEAVFKKIFALFETEKQNEIGSISLIIEAIRKNRIIYTNSKFIAVNGKFGVKLAGEIRRLGGVKSGSSYRLKLVEGDPVHEQIRAELATQKLETEKKINEINSILNEESVIGEVSDKIATKLIESISSQLEKSFGIEYELTEERKRYFVQSYINNVSYYSKKLSYNANLRLKAIMLAQTANQNLTVKSLYGAIASEFGVSANHARFIARQETSIVKEQINQLTATELGFSKYVWQTAGDYRVRTAGEGKSFIGPNHKRLHGKVFDFKAPPIVDTMTGKRCNPGIDFNCRCTARVIIDDKYYDSI